MSVSLLGVHFSVVYFFFFFQAEDGIRDWSVTGVQTCALPICRHLHPRGAAHTPRCDLAVLARHTDVPALRRRDPHGARAVAQPQRPERPGSQRELTARCLQAISYTARAAASTWRSSLDRKSVV